MSSPRATRSLSQAGPRPGELVREVGHGDGRPPRGRPNEKLADCRRACLFTYCGSWGGWEAPAGSPVRELSSSPRAGARQREGSTQTPALVAPVTIARCPSPESATFLACCDGSATVATRAPGRGEAPAS